VLPHSRQLLRDSWELAQPNVGRLTRDFYARLFEIDPDAARLFTGVEMTAQHRKFRDMLHTIVLAVERDDPSALVLTGTTLGRRHEGYGVEERHYELVGEALLEALAHALGAAWTGDVRDAWREAYALLASLMRRGAAHAADEQSVRGAAPKR